MEFKKLSDVEVIAEPTESANVLIEENGVIKKAPKTAVGGGGGGVFIHYRQDSDTIVGVTPNSFEILTDGFTKSLGVPIFVLNMWGDAEFSSRMLNGIYLNLNDEDGRYVRVDAEALIIQLYEDGHVSHYWAD